MNIWFAKLMEMNKYYKCTSTDDKSKPEEKNESEHAEAAPEKPTKIVVSNLPSFAHEEVLEMFFENTRMFGGESVFSVEVDEKEGTAVIEFDEPEAVQRVLSKRPIAMMGQKIDVEIFVPEEPKPKCTIEVTGPPDVVSEEQLETLEMYFENKRRSGGGEVVGTIFDPEEDMALITFKTEEIAMRVVDKVVHAIKKQKLNVQLHIPETKKCKKKQTNVETAEPAEVEEEPPKCTVKVKGVDKTASRDTLEFYLENARRSGGGEIESINSDEEEEDVLYVTFKSPEAAMRVAERKHNLENRTLKASLYVPPKAPPSYEDRVLIKGLNPSTTQDCLFNFIEAKTSFIPERMDYHADQEGVVMVTFQMGKEDLDFDKLEKVFRRSKLEGASLKVSRVPIPDCIIVANLIPEVTGGTVEYYFENVRKSGGGPLKRVVMNDDGTCLVYFEDYTVIDKVLKRQHTLGNQSLDVQRYQEYLGRPEGELAERKLRTPEDIIVQDVDSSLVKFMKTLNTNQTAIKKQLELCHAEVHWPEDEKGDVILKCTITLATSECFRLVKYWKKEALKNFQDYLKLLAVHKVPVLQDIWHRVIDELKTVSVPNPDTVALYVDKKSGFITVVGNKHVADNLRKTVEDIAKKVLEEAEKEKYRVKESVTSLKPIETRMLLAAKFPFKIESAFPELRVEINQNKNEILFEGMLGDIKTAMVQMYELKQSFASTTVDLGAPNKVGLYYLKQTKDYIVKKLKSRGAIAVWEVTDGKLKVMSSGDEELEKSLDIVQNSVAEKTIALKPASMSLMNSELWATRVQELHATHAGMCNIIVSDTCSKIHIVTTDDIVNEIRDNVKKFLRLNTVTVDVFVNPADDKLSLSGGLGRAFSNKDDIEKKELTNRENTVSLGSTEDFDFCCDPCLTVDHRSEAQAFCISCQENLCKKCFDTHKKLRFSRNHKVEDTPRKLAKSFVPENARAVSTESCTFHQGEFIKFFCQQHNTLGCNDCMTLYHRACDIDYIPTVCKGITKTKHYKDLLSDVKKAVQNRQTFEFKVMSSLTETERSIETAVADIEDFQVKINVKINSIKGNLLQQLKSHKSNDTQQAVEILSTNKTVLSELKTLQEALEKFETSGQDADAYITIRQTQSTLQTLRCRKELYEAEMRKYNFVQDTALRDILSSCKSLGEISRSSHPFSVETEFEKAQSLSDDKFQRQVKKKSFFG